MQLVPGIHLVASGSGGFDLTERSDEEATSTANRQLERGFVPPSVV